MNLRISTLVFGLCGATTVMAADYQQSVGVGAFELFNVKISASVSGSAGPSLAPKTDRNYLDGFNRVDSSGNLGEGAPGLPSRTSNFGFTSNQQVDLQRGTLSLHTVSPDGSRYFNRSSVHSRAGGEIYYTIVRTQPNAPVFGLEARAGLIDVHESSSAALPSSVRLLTDAYALGGVVPQPAPYTGSFTVQPGTQRIGDTPTRTSTSVAATAEGRREFTAKGWLLRLGAIWEPVSAIRWSVQVHGGAALMNLKGELHLNERWSASGLPALTATADGSRTKALAGFYAGATARMHLNARWSLFAGADYLNAGKFSVRGGDAVAKFDFSGALLASGGLAFRF